MSASDPAISALTLVAIAGLLLLTIGLVMFGTSVTFGLSAAVVLASLHLLGVITIETAKTWFIYSVGLGCIIGFVRGLVLIATADRNH